MKSLCREVLGYGAASLCALVVDISMLWMLVQSFGWWYLQAATVSFLAGAVVAYVLSANVVFKQHRLHDRRIEFLTFFGIGVMGLAVNAAVISVAVRFAGLHYITAKCVAAACTFSCNFLARRQVLFVRSRSV